MTVREVHVVPDEQADVSEPAWTVQINGQVLGPVHPSRDDALAAAREVARREQAEVVLHDSDGSRLLDNDARYPQGGDEGAPSYW